MASWMVHLRIADIILNEQPELSPTEFIIGNIAPDSGVPNEDWTTFIPSGNVSHFKTTDVDGFKEIHLNEFVEQYLSENQRRQYSSKQNSFYLGYLTHLITDMMWSEQIVRPSVHQFEAQFNKDRTKLIQALKKDWYDLDFLYIKNHPEFKAYTIYRNAVGFRNKYIPFFSVDAFEYKRAYITSFYNNIRDNIDREYNYLSEKEMASFVDSSSTKILQTLRADYL